MVADTHSELRRHRLLVVEDTKIVADEIVFILRTLGFEVVGPFTRVCDALAALEREEIDGGLLDVNLGSETAYPIASKLIERGTPFLFMSGYDAAELDAAFRLMPCIAKPFTGSELERALQRVLHRNHEPAAHS